MNDVLTERKLPDGLVLRPATPADLPQIGALLTTRGEPADAVDHRLVMEDDDAGWSACGVVVDGDRVVSTATLLDETLWLAGVPIPAGQLELVATDREYEGRGLVRALLHWAHARSAARGQLVQLVIGIPYFYRQFGYVYAIPMAEVRQLATPPPEPVDCRVREADAADLPALAALADATQTLADLRMPHSTACWRWLIARDASRQLVVERAGTVVGAGRIATAGAGVRLAELAGSAPEAGYALLRYAVRRAGGRPVRVYHRPATLIGQGLAPYLAPPSEHESRYYVRVGDPAALLARLRPVLSARLAGSALASAEGEAVLSFYRSHLRFSYRGGVIGRCHLGGVRQWPGEHGAAVPPDLVAPLLFGPTGFAGLARSHPDVSAAAPVAELMRILFPPVRSDLLTFYLP